MPRSALGQLITFAIQVDHDTSITGYTTIKVRLGDSIQKLASRQGQPGAARLLADLNGERSTHRILSHSPRKTKDKSTIRIPSRFANGQVFSALAGATPPKIIGGYAKYETIDRYARTGLTQFKGHDPLTMEVPIQFEAYTVRNDDGEPIGGEGVENAIRLLERMAGRGAFAGAGIGAPPVIRASTTNGAGIVVGLIPTSYQWTFDADGPLWRVANITWDDGAIRDKHGNRIRAGCTVTLQQHTHAALLSVSAATRAG